MSEIAVRTPMDLLQFAIEKGVDTDQLKGLLDLQNRWREQQAEQAWNEAKAACDAEMPAAIATNADNNHTRSKYLRFETLMPKIKPIYTKHGFSLAFSEEGCDKLDLMHVRADLTHRAGHTKSYHGWFPRDGIGAKGGNVMNALQGTCSTLSYAKREMTENIFGIAEGGSDRDGNGPVEFLTTEEMLQLNDAISDLLQANKPFDMAKFLAWASEATKTQIKHLDRFPRSLFDRSMSILKKKMSK